MPVGNNLLTSSVAYKSLDKNRLLKFIATKGGNSNSDSKCP